MIYCTVFLIVVRIFCWSVSTSSVSPSRMVMLWKFIFCSSSSFHSSILYAEYSVFLRYSSVLSCSRFLTVPKQSLNFTWKGIFYRKEIRLVVFALVIFTIFPKIIIIDISYDHFVPIHYNARNSVKRTYFVVKSLMKIENENHKSYEKKNENEKHNDLNSSTTITFHIHKLELHNLWKKNLLWCGYGNELGLARELFTGT